MRHYQRMSLEEREEVSRLLSMDRSFREIGRQLERSPSTISREIRRCSWQAMDYRAVRANRQAQKRSSRRRKYKRKLGQSPELFQYVCEKLRQFWSPEQIAQELKRRYDNPHMHVSAETVYTYLYVLPRGELKKELLACLRRAHKKRRTQGHSQKGQPSKLEDMLSIEERPAQVADRSVPGHWEGDLLIGGMREQSALGTLVERTTRSVLLVPLKNKTATEVRMQFAKEIKKLPKEMRLTLTYDQGREMAQHKLFTQDTKMKVYFAHPRSPWERGTNENTNGLLRQFFPKGTNFNHVSRKDIKRAQHLLNGRPRKTLNWKTPYEAMNELLR